MSNNKNSLALPDENYISELLGEISDPVHKQIIEVYGGIDPLQAMETKLREILSEVLRSES
ncbi:MAG: hypothetical protein QME83_04610 [Thermodesulfobacteriota bacterium]|nr:hypothetical protein [Thermodesulfobacteriota bacterium]